MTSSVNVKPNIISGTDLLEKTFPKLNYIAEPIIAEGLTVLASKPKVGKSWMMMNLCLSVASDQLFCNHYDCVKGDVLYLALEDNHSRLQRRIALLSSSTRELDNVDFACNWPLIGEGCEEALEEWIMSKSTPKLIIVDTYQRIKGRSRGADKYAEDYDNVSALQQIASKHRLAIILVHHQRKDEASDTFDTVSGTHGITGAADTVAIIDGGKYAKILSIRGRDIEEQESAIQFNSKTFMWEMKGNARVADMGRERTKILETIKEANTPLTIPKIQEKTKMKPENLRKLLSNMAKEGDLHRPNNTQGLYALPDHISH